MRKSQRARCTVILPHILSLTMEWRGQNMNPIPRPISLSLSLSPVRSIGKKAVVVVVVQLILRIAEQANNLLALQERFQNWGGK